jgi:hypothetical protein
MQYTPTKTFWHRQSAVALTVAYDANGAWEIRPPKGKPG